MSRVLQRGLELDPEEKGLLAAVAKTEKALAKQKAGKEAILLGSSHLSVTVVHLQGSSHLSDCRAYL